MDESTGDVIILFSSFKAFVIDASVVFNPIDSNASCNCFAVNDGFNNPLATN